MIDPLPHIDAMAPYELAQLGNASGGRLISMAQNESIRPPSPQVADAIKGALSKTHLYPDPDWAGLCRAIAKVHAVPQEQIVCGAGSMELIACLAQTYLDSRSSILTTQYAYAFFKTAANLNNARILAAPEPSFTVSVDHLLDLCADDTRILFLANPGNPTGTRIANSEIRRLRKALPAQTLLVIDEAYGEFVDSEDPPLFDLCAAGNTAIVRTFSKAYGLAGMRVGWGVFPVEIASQLRKVLNPNNISFVSQVAAQAAMDDQDYMHDTCRMTIRLREEFRQRLDAFGLHCPMSDTNFLLIPFDQPNDAMRANQVLQSNGIVMRPMGGYGLPNCLRATLVDEHDMVHVYDAFDQWASRG